MREVLFLLSVIEDLKERGVDEKDIVYINFDRREYKSVKTPEQLEAVIAEAVTDSAFKYIFTDEIQNADEFEEVINALREDGNCSIFITDSNSYLLSGELITKLTGRYSEIEMFTLSFGEFWGMKKILHIPVSENRAKNSPNIFISADSRKFWNLPPRKIS